MWTYSKKLEYPVKIARPDAAAAKVIISQLGGPEINKIQRGTGKSGASLKSRFIVCNSRFRCCLPAGQIQSFR